MTNDAAKILAGGAFTYMQILFAFLKKGSQIYNYHKIRETSRSFVKKKYSKSKSKELKKEFCNYKIFLSKVVSNFQNVKANSI